VILHDPSVEPTKEEGHRTIAIPFDALAKQTGESRAANMVVMGALSHLMNTPVDYFKSFVSSRFAGRDAIIAANHMALDLGRAEVSEEKPIAELGTPSVPAYEQIFIKGNEAICIGALAAGLNFYVGYPISPATPILLYMERNLVGEGKFSHQVSSELEAITAILGAGYAGKKAMTATSGPGLSLMGEGLGLGWMAELPCVVVNVQRGGPATGLPTKTEQSDLLVALNPAHGDARFPVIAPGTVEECFYAAVTALNWAERYQGPVILLSEHSLAERAQNIAKPDLSTTSVEQRQVYTGSNGYQRYDSLEISPMPIPGGPGAYVANGSEHDGMGDTTHLGERHIQMTNRRFSKLHLLENGDFEHENTEQPIAILPWGGSKGSAREAYELLLSQGHSAAWYYTMYLNPMPVAMVEELRKKELVLVPELNYLGQFAGVLRSMGIRAEAITQITGLPFGAGDLAERIADRITATKQTAKA